MVGNIICSGLSIVVLRLRVELVFYDFSDIYEGWVGGSYICVSGMFDLETVEDCEWGGRFWERVRYLEKVYGFLGRFGGVYSEDVFLKERCM